MTTSLRCVCCDRVLEPEENEICFECDNVIDVDITEYIEDHIQAQQTK